MYEYTHIERLIQALTGFSLFSGTSGLDLATPWPLCPTSTPIIYNIAPVHPNTLRKVLLCTKRQTSCH